MARARKFTIGAVVFVCVLMIQSVAAAALSPTQQIEVLELKIKALQLQLDILALPLSDAPLVNEKRSLIYAAAGRIYTIGEDMLAE